MMQSRLVFAAAWFIALAFVTTHVCAQTLVVKGTVSTATTTVRNASVMFQDAAPPGNTFSTTTDSAGQYQVSLTLTSVNPVPALPVQFELEQNYPNPFSASTAISYQLREQSDIRVTIYDVLGQVVRETNAGAQPEGVHGIVWDGTNASGQRVAPGVYFYTLQAGGETQTRKMIFSGGINGVLSLPQTYVPLFRSKPQGIQPQLQGGNFTVFVSNTISTIPPIVSSQFNNVVVQGDTTIDFRVIAASVSVSRLFPDSMLQSIRGFGAANILPWRPDMTADQVQKAFGSGPGQIGFTILRLRIPFTDSPTDFAQQVPTAQLAQSLGAIVFASPWTPPPALKSNNNIVGGTLNDTSYAAYAAHLKGFADYMAANGAPLYAVSLQNEPDANVTYESCSWNASQFLKFMRNNASAIGTRIMMPESQNFVHALSDSTLNDSTAAAHLAVVAGHIYGGGLGPYPLAVSKGKEIWMTEHLVLDTTWMAALSTGREIHDCMNAGMNAYVWWYIVRFYGPILEDGTVSKRGYVMSQYARFVRPGYVRIKCDAAPQRNVVISAYKDPGSSRIVIVVLNSAISVVQQAFTVDNSSMFSVSQYTTSISKNCEKGDDIPVTNGSFAVSLEPSSITTFVSK